MGAVSNWLLILIATVVIGVPRLGAAQVFLTYDQFSALDHPQQLAYVEAVRKLVLSLARNPHLSAEMEVENLFFKKVDFISRALPMAWAQSQLSALCHVPSAGHFSTEDLLSKMQQMQNCREVRINGGPAYFLPVVPNSASVLAQEYNQRIEDGRMSPNSYGVKEASGGLGVVISELRSVGVKGGGNYNEILDQAETYLQRAKARFGAASRSSSSSRTAGSGRSTARNMQDTTPGEGLSSKPTVREPSRSSSQCLYGGFVIDQRSMKGCHPLSQLPKEFESSFFPQDGFRCGGSTPVLCNPLLFGYLPDCDDGEKPPCYKKKPLCTSRSPRATADCHNRAKERNTLRYTEDVWNGPDGQKMYESFIKSLESLCDSENLERRNLKIKSKLDIEKTCNVAFQAFDELVEKKFLPRNSRKGSGSAEVQQPGDSGAQK